MNHSKQIEPRFIAGPPGTGKTHKYITKLYKELLSKYVRMSPTKLEEIEQIEQLRLIENRIIINAVEVNDDGISVDTPKDLIIMREQYKDCFLN